MKTWSLQNVWNEVLIQEKRDLRPRDRIHASEIGKVFWERYQKMIGTPFTNDYEERILRKFAAGHFFEDMIGHVLSKIGILHSSQKRVEIPECEDHLMISGYVDFEAGGVSNWDEARKNVREADFPDAIANIALSLIQYFEKTYPNGLEKKLYEIKSVNSQVFWAKKDYLEEAYPWHVFQIYTYMRTLGYDSGTILYISKDDLTVKEIEVEKTPELEAQWLDDVKTMSEHYRNKKEPLMPDPVIFDARKKYRFSAKRDLEALGTERELDKKARYKKIGEVFNGYKCVMQGSYEVNWQTVWSPYRDLITGTKNNEEYDAWEAKTRQQANDLNKTKLRTKFINNLKDGKT